MLTTAFHQYINPKIKTIYLGLSGGVDSIVLAHVARQQHNLIAVHINHGLEPDANLWQQHCVEFCRQHHIELQTYNLNLKLNNNIEAQARNARYQKFSELLEQDDILLLAQHQNDQAETVLLRLLRGSGPVGLAAMSPERRLGKGKLIRPWLNIAKSDILLYAQQNQLSWVDDSSNLNNRFDRNFLRNELIPIIASKWPSWSQTISRSADLCRQASQHELKASKTLAIESLDTLSLSQASTKIYHWLRANTNDIPSKQIIEKIVTEVAFAKLDAQPQISWNSQQVRRYQGKLYFLSKIYFLTRNPVEYILDDELYLPECKLKLINQSKHKLTIKYPIGGEKILIFGQNKKLKKILQQHLIPPWLRPITPLVYLNGQLQQVVGVCHNLELVKCEQ